MIDKEKLKKEYEKGFDRLKKELGFKVSFEELEEEFYIIESIYEKGFVRDNLEIQICSRIVENFRSWGVYLNGLLFPSSGNYSNQVESKIFSLEKDKNEIWSMIKLCMNVSSKYSLIFLNKDKVAQGIFIDESFQNWKDSLKPFLIKILQKVNGAWKQ